MLREHVEQHAAVSAFVELLPAHAKEKIANRAFRSMASSTGPRRAPCATSSANPELLTAFLAGAGFELAPPTISP
ncbi:hypothetical protein ACFYW6_40175 [Streptomyces sp. NPDC002659]|uniref:hypothetical protein n=1 Tax=Streptomyces sp. NPDC002659 TaxID=3364656 RepID=UPI00368AEFD3